MIAPASSPFLTARRRRAYRHEARTLQDMRQYDAAAAFSASVRRLAARPVVTVRVGGDRL